MDPTYSPTSFVNDNSDFSDGPNSTYSRQFVAPDTDEEEDDEDDHKRKKKVHRGIEAKRRETEAKHFRELSSLIPNWYEAKTSKLPQLVLLQIAADLIDQINLRHQNDPLLPSYLTADEVNFLNLEASNAFLFVTTIEPSLFRVIHVTDSIYRILQLMPEQWLNQNFLTFIHPDDLLQVQSQLLYLTQHMETKLSLKCRLQQGNGSYSSVMMMDGRIKKIDQSLKPVSTNEQGFFAFIGVCHLPLTTEYSEKNISLHQNCQALTFSCRCSPNDWKIFVVDRSISTFLSVSFDFFRDKSILDFIHIDERAYVHQALLNSTITAKDELITCHFIYSSTEIFTMILDIKPVFNPSTKQTDFIELIFKNITDIVINPN